MSAVDMVLHTSIAPEPFGRVIVEGMMAQKPVIATAAGEALEIIENGVTGMLVECEIISSSREVTGHGNRGGASPRDRVPAE
ncbi:MULTISPECIES: glycosyltransferase [Methylosinus]|nr:MULTISPECIES: glycosyltransferase [Methylosinus]